MLKQVFCSLCTNNVPAQGVFASRYGVLVLTSGVHSGQWPYTDQKGKKSKNPIKHMSFKQRTRAYMEPFTLDVAVAVLKSQSDTPACLAVGQALADGGREADECTASYTARARDKFEGKIITVVQSLIDIGIDIKFILSDFPSLSMILLMYTARYRNIQTSLTLF
ncbi:hypothetical protein ACJRO7_011230 [Eucalyptus globulus]|uniref:Uncharacterized protein n=1 Tax=Eucalyptus globulus TaxID=34317 RepID=A0ABD3LI33_EUCGL